MKIPKAIPHVLACSALLLWSGDLTAEDTVGVRGQAGPVIPDLLQYELQNLELPATEQQPFTTEVRLGGQTYTLILEPFSMRADDFRVLVQGEDGQLRQVESPPSRTYRGAVQGQPRSRVAGSLIDGQLSVVIALESGETWQIQPVSDYGIVGAPNASHVIYQGKDIGEVEGVCGTDDIPQPLADLGDQDNDGDPTSSGTGLSMTDIAFDADWEFYLANGSSVPATVADIENVMVKVELVYERDTDISYEITTFVVRTTNADPYSSTDAGTLLNQFRVAWNTAPETSIRSDIAQLFTGKNLNGGTVGIAWVGTVCNVSGLGYSLVQSRFHPNSDLRASLSAHELGHNWNSLHCSGGGCHIMCSFINGCGGTTGTNLKFGTLSKNAIINFRNSRGCLFNLPDPLFLPFSDEFNVAVIDTAKWIYNFGGAVITNGVNEPSEPRSLNLDGAGNIYQKDEIRTNFINAIGEQGSILSYWTEHRGVESGETLVVEYWALNKTWKNLNTIVSNGTDQNNYVFHSHDLPADAYHSQFRVRFRTTVNSSSDDWYVDDVFIGMPPDDPCPWDLDTSGVVGLADLLELLAAWGPNPGHPADFDGDDTVGLSDLLELLANWGPCP